MKRARSTGKKSSAGVLVLLTGLATAGSAAPGAPRSKNVDDAVDRAFRSQDGTILYGWEGHDSFGARSGQNYLEAENKAAAQLKSRYPDLPWDAIFAVSQKVTAMNKAVQLGTRDDYAYELDRVHVQEAARAADSCKNEIDLSACLEKLLSSD